MKNTMEDAGINQFDFAKAHNAKIRVDLKMYGKNCKPPQSLEAITGIKDYGKKYGKYLKGKL